MGDVVCMGVEFHFCRECEKCARRQSTAHRASPPSPSRAPPLNFFRWGSPKPSHSHVLYAYSYVKFRKGNAGKQNFGKQPEAVLCLCSAGSAIAIREQICHAKGEKSLSCICHSMPSGIQSHIFFNFFFQSFSSVVSQQIIFFFINH